MSHYLYRTEGFLLDGFEYGEDSRGYFLLTRDLGLVAALAQGVRLLKSKLRYSLGYGTALSVELIRGRSSWRLVSAESASTTFQDEKAKMYKRVGNLIRRLVHGEEKNEKLFLAFSDLNAFLTESGLSNEEINILELISVARVLSALGYWGGNDIPEKFLKEPLKKELLPEAQTESEKLTIAVNRALRESHL